MKNLAYLDVAKVFPRVYVDVRLSLVDHFPLFANKLGASDNLTQRAREVTYNLAVISIERNRSQLDKVNVSRSLELLQFFVAKEIDRSTIDKEVVRHISSLLSPPKRLELKK